MSVDYSLLKKQLESLLFEDDFIINSAQFSAFIYSEIPNLNWAGFYLYRDEVLKLGPFQGKVACTVIPLSKGVCGASFSERKTYRVADVHEFAGHIACDSASNSEVVIPLVNGDECFGVFDIDSPLKSRFSEEDQKGLEDLVVIFLSKTNCPKSFEFKK